MYAHIHTLFIYMFVICLNHDCVCVIVCLCVY